MLPETMRTKGFLTPTRREYLHLSVEKRKKLYPKKGALSQYDFHIKRQAIQAIKDLTLVSSAYPKKRNREIFTIEDIAHLLEIIIVKQGFETTNYGPYYMVLIDVIMKSLNSINSDRKTVVDCLMIENPNKIPSLTDDGTINLTTFYD